MSAILTACDRLPSPISRRARRISSGGREMHTRFQGDGRGDLRRRIFPSQRMRSGGLRLRLSSSRVSGRTLLRSGFGFGFGFGFDFMVGCVLSGIWRDAEPRVVDEGSPKPLDFRSPEKLEELPNRPGLAS